MANQPHIVNPAAAPLQNFVTDMAAPLKECKVYFEPVQEGSGDAGPENVRNINGWNGIELKHSNINLYDDVIMESKYYKWCIPEALIGPELIYSMEVDNTNGTNEACIRIVFKDKNDTTISRIARTSGIMVGNKSRDAITFTDAMPLNTNYIYFGTSGKNTIITNPMVEIRTRSVWDLSQYEPYTGITIPITFPSEAGTLYGGYVDLVNGEVVKEYQYVKVNSSNTSIRTGTYDGPSYYYPYGRFMRTELSDCDWQKNNSLIKCNALSYITKTADFNSASHGFFRPGASPVYYWKHPDCATEEGATELRDADIYFAYPLVTPITYQLTPAQLKTLHGTNNIWSNSNGDITVRFWRY